MDRQEKLISQDFMQFIRKPFYQKIQGGQESMGNYYNNYKSLAAMHQKAQSKDIFENKTSIGKQYLFKNREIQIITSKVNQKSKNQTLNFTADVKNIFKKILQTLGIFFFFVMKVGISQLEYAKIYL